MHDPKNTLTSATPPGNANVLSLTCFLNGLRSALLCFEETAESRNPSLACGSSHRKLPFLMYSASITRTRAQARPAPAAPARPGEARPSIPYVTRSCTVTYSRFDSQILIRNFRIVSVVSFTYSAVSYSRLWSEETYVLNE